MLVGRLRDDLAEMLTSRQAKPGGVLTSEGLKGLSVLTSRPQGGVLTCSNNL
jgi:hypothetical protein